MLLAAGGRTYREGGDAMTLWNEIRSFLSETGQALGITPCIERAFDAWVTQHSNSLNPGQATMLRLLKQRVLTGDTIELRIFSQPPFSIYGGRARMEQLFGKDGLTQVVEELNTLLAA